MTTGVTNPKVDWFFDKATQWQKEYEKLRMIILECGLTEELKWGCPCYQFEKRNIVLIHGFKEYCALLFFKGALLADADGILIQQTENVQSARQIRFTSARQIVKMEGISPKYSISMTVIKPSPSYRLWEERPKKGRSHPRILKHFFEAK